MAKIHVLIYSDEFILNYIVWNNAILQLQMLTIGY